MHAATSPDSSATSSESPLDYVVSFLGDRARGYARKIHGACDAQYFEERDFERFDEVLSRVESLVSMPFNDGSVAVAHDAVVQLELVIRGHMGRYMQRFWQFYGDSDLPEVARCRHDAYVEIQSGRMAALSGLEVRLAGGDIASPPGYDARAPAAHTVKMMSHAA